MPIVPVTQVMGVNLVIACYKLIQIMNPITSSCYDQLKQKTRTPLFPWPSPAQILGTERLMAVTRRLVERSTPCRGNTPP